MDNKILENFKKLASIIPQYTDIPNYDLELLGKIQEEMIKLQDKLHRRNMQIKELKKQLQDVIPTSALSWKCFTCGQVYKFSTLEPLKNIIPSCFCNKPDCRIIINR